MELSMATRKAITRALALQYRDGSKDLKGEILDTVCGLTGYHRDYARRALRAALKPRPVRPRAPRTPKYDPKVVAALAKCWAMLNAPAGKRLAPMLAELVPLLRRHGGAGPRRPGGGAAGRDVGGHDRPQAGRRPVQAAAPRPFAYQAGVDAEVADRDADLGRSRRGHPRVRRGRLGRPRGR